MTTDNNDVTSQELLTTATSVTGSSVSASSSTVRTVVSQSQLPPRDPPSPVWRNNAFEPVNLTSSPVHDFNNNSTITRVNDKLRTDFNVPKNDEDEDDSKEMDGLKGKSGFPHELKNETREALQEEGSHHQPVVFVGGSGFIPPNNLRQRPILEADPLWHNRPLLDSQYPVQVPSAWDRNYRNPFNMTRVQRE